MTKTKVGERVYAIASADDDTVRLFGCGVYEGEHSLTDEVGGLAWAVASPFLNPRIRLDSGQVVWGCECWWGPETQLAKFVGVRSVIREDIDMARAAAKGPPDADR